MNMNDQNNVLRFFTNNIDIFIVLHVKELFQYTHKKKKPPNFY